MTFKMIPFVLTTWRWFLHCLSAHQQFAVLELLPSIHLSFIVYEKHFDNSNELIVFRSFCSCSFKPPNLYRQKYSNQQWNTRWNRSFSFWLPYQNVRVCESSKIFDGFSSYSFPCLVRFPLVFCYTLLNLILSLRRFYFLWSFILSNDSPWLFFGTFCTFARKLRKPNTKFFFSLSNRKQLENAYKYFCIWYNGSRTLASHHLTTYSTLCMYNLKTEF